MGKARNNCSNRATTSRRQVLAGIGATSLFLLQACDRRSGRTASAGARAESPTGLPRQGGSLRVSIDQVARGLNPIKHVLNSEFLMGELLFNGLTRLGYDMLPEPDLAIAWSANERLDEWTFQLRPGVRFHDGSPLEAADVAATINAILDPATGSPARSSIGPISSVAVVDPLTVRCHLSAPYADLPTALTHRCARIVRAAAIKDGSLLDRTAIGTGPFMLTTFDPARVIDVKRNPNFFRPGQPHVDRVQVFVYPDSTAESSALLSGGIDLMAKVSAADYTRIAQTPGVVGVQVRSGEMLKIAMACDRPPFNDVRVRRALASCVDREMLLAILAEEYGTVANDTPVCPVHRFYYQTQPKRPDPQSARQLLTEAGYPDGLDLDLIAVNHPASKQDFAVAMREMARPAGFRISVKVVPQPIYLDQVWLKGQFYVGVYEMQPTIDAVSSLLFTSQAPWNDSHWHDPVFDRLIAEARSEVDPDKRGRLYAEAQTYMSDQTPSIIPVFFDVLAAHVETLHGFRAHPSGVSYRLEDVWLS